MGSEWSNPNTININNLFWMASQWHFRYATGAEVNFIMILMNKWIVDNGYNKCTTGSMRDQVMDCFDEEPGHHMTHCSPISLRHMALLPQHIKAKTKCSTFRKRRYQKHFMCKQKSYLNASFTEIYSHSLIAWCRSSDKPVSKPMMTMMTYAYMRR